MCAQASDAMLVFVTAVDKREARRLAMVLVRAGLASCVQILPEIESVYRWDGTVQREKEILILIKTTGARFEELEHQVRLLHSYQVPEILAVRVAAISEPYLKWLTDTLKPSSEIVQ
jgi:periplasmic divalent cation tolerance protein